MEYYLNEDGSKRISNLLYKYSTINENLFSLLINSELWFNDPLDFNDPYDCNLNYNLSDITYDKVYEHLTRSNKKLDVKETDAHIKDRAKQIFDNPDEISSLLNKLTETYVKNSGVTCFSQRDSILLMWSHYADSHRGVCLTFDMEKDEDFFNYPYKVDYPPMYPQINPFNEGDTGLQVHLATKSQEWDYEEEVRIIKGENYTPKFRGTVGFKPEALTEIKFGYRCSEEQIKTIKNLVSKKYPHIKIYTSKIKKKQFGIEFHPYTVEV